MLVVLLLVVVFTGCDVVVAFVGTDVVVGRELVDSVDVVIVELVDPGVVVD